MKNGPVNGIRPSIHRLASNTEMSLGGKWNIYIYIYIYKWNIYIYAIYIIKIDKVETCAISNPKV